MERVHAIRPVLCPLTLHVNACLLTQTATEYIQPPLIFNLLTGMTTSWTAESIEVVLMHGNKRAIMS